jgi:hypothetical protein
MVLRANPLRYIGILLPGIGNGGRCKIDPNTAMSRFGQTTRVQTGPTGEIRYLSWFSGQDCRVDPTYLLIDNFCSTAGRIVILGQVFGKHARTEVRIMPWYFSPPTMD